ncbi:hypothetical protein RhiirA4_412906, partial [Rhizophagus irregularis]
MCPNISKKYSKFNKKFFTCLRDVLQIIDNDDGCENISKSLRSLMYINGGYVSSKM